MESSRIFLLLIGIWCVILVRPADAVCCSSGDTIIFSMSNGGECSELGAEDMGEFDGFCNAKICADGEVLKGRFCGKGRCNMFGCNCVGGCRRGDWGESFAQRNDRYGVAVFNQDVY